MVQLIVVIALLLGLSGMGSTKNSKNSFGFTPQDDIHGGGTTNGGTPTYP
jgi:hypothetical protein